MTKPLRSILLLLALLVPLLTACAGGGGATPSPSPSPEAAASPEASPEASPQATTEASPEATAGAGGNASNVRVALVTDVGKVNDGTFNQFAYEGLVRARDELGIQIDFIETQQPTDYERNLDQFANQDYDLVIGVGFLMGEAVQAAAARHPDVNFAIVDFAYENPAPNLKGLIFNEDEAAYMVGTMAALVSKSNVIGVVGGIDVPAVQKFVKGYEAGAKAQKPDIRVLSVYIPSFTDPAAGAEAARSMIAEGADVIFGAGGQTGSGAIQAAAQQGVWVIGVDQDEYNTTFNRGAVQGADKIITSAIKRVDNAVFDTIKSVVEGNWSNEPYVGTTANGGVDYADCHEACAVITPEIKAKVDEVKQGLANGTIKTNVTVE